MEVTQTQLTKYLTEFYPAILQEVSEKMTAIECTSELVSTITAKVIASGYDYWEVKLITLATVLRLCSPETIFTKSNTRKTVCTKVAEEFGVTNAAISKIVGQAKYYYTNMNWVKNEVDKIVKEVVDGKVNG